MNDEDNYITYISKKENSSENQNIIFNNEINKPKTIKIKQQNKYANYDENEKLNLFL